LEKPEVPDDRFAEFFQVRRIAVRPHLPDRHRLHHAAQELKFLNPHIQCYGDG
jgi:hypothetical protein